MTSKTFIDSTTLRLRAKKVELETKIECLLTMNTKYVWGKSAAKSKSRRQAEKADKLEKENDDLSRQLGEIKETVAQI